MIIIELFIFLVMCNCMMAQSSFDISNLLELKITRPDSLAKKYHIKSIFIYEVNANHERKICQIKKYDQNGYLKTIVRYDSSDLKGIITIKYGKKGNNVFTAITNMNRMSVVNASAYTFLGGFRAYLDNLNRSRNDMIAKSVYKVNQDLSLEIITIVDGEKKDSIHDASLLYIPSKGTSNEILKGDTTYVGDSLVISFKENAGGNEKMIGKRFYIKKAKKPVKLEFIKYIGDSLTFFSGQVWQYDKLDRPIFYGEYQGPPYKLFMSEETVYNDTTGEKTIYNDAFPSDGKTDKIWKYNKIGQLIEYTKFTDLNLSTNFFKTTYNGKQLIKEDEYFLNGVYKGGKIYEYVYYQ